MSLYITEHAAGITALYLAVPVTVFITKFLLEPSPSPVLLPEGSTKRDA